MTTPFLRNVRKVSLFVGISLVVFIATHQLSYGYNFSPASVLTEGNVIEECYQAPHTKSSDGSARQVNSRIPNIVHQLWTTADLHTYPAKASHQSWKDKSEAGNFTVKLWTDHDVLRLIRSNYSWLLSTYEKYPQNTNRANLAKLIVLHSEGGIYADLDVFPRNVEMLQCLQHLDKQAIIAPNTRGFATTDHFFMAEKGAEVIQWTLQEVKRQAEPEPSWRNYFQVFGTTGPLMITSAFLQYAWLYSGSDHRLGVLDQDYSDAIIKHVARPSLEDSNGSLWQYIADNPDVELLLIAIPLSAMIPGLVYTIFKRSSRRIHLK